MLGVTKFADYIASGIAVFVVKALSFLVTFLAVTILIRMTVFTLDSIRRLPVLHGFDRLAGAVLGLGFGLILVWLSFLVLTLACGTELGRECFLRIEQSKILTFLYRTNYLVNMMIVK